MENNTNNIIYLNFLPIEGIQNLEFTIFVRRVIDNNEEKWDENIRRYNKLSFDDNTAFDFWVSFSSFENSEEQEVKFNFNFDLTKWYLSYILEQRLKNLEINYERDIKNFNHNRIFIITEVIKNKGKRCVWFEPYYFKNPIRFGFLVDYKFKKELNCKFDRDIQKLSFSLDEYYRSNRNYHIDKNRYIKSFIERKSGILSLNFKLNISKDFIEIQSNKLSAKNYIFFDSNTNTSQFRGISENGPYQSIQVNELIFNYLFLFKDEHKDLANDLIKALNGISFKTFDGLNKFFKLPYINKENTKWSKVISYDIIPEDDIIAKNPNILIAIFPESEEEFYYKLKSFCLKNSIPLQCVHTNTLAKENQLKWSISSIALQMFTKLGGIPWLVSSQNSNCLIVGYGQSIEKDDTGVIKRFFAYSVILESNGNFLEIKPLGEGYDKESFLDSLSQRVYDLLSEEKYKSYNKIVFHIPEKISKDCIKTIQGRLADLKSNVEFYIIRINDDSKFFGYGKNNSLIPYESDFIKLRDKEFLLWTEGLNYHNPTPRKRYANPIYIDFYYSNQSKIDYILFLQDILNLSGANYRGFNAKSLPVSIFYPKLISDFYKNFEKIQIKTQLESKNRMWFL